MRRLKLNYLIAFIVLTAVLNLNAQMNDAVSSNGQLQVIGLKLCNESGTPIQLRGMSTHGIHWYGQCINDASLDALAYDWDADVLRISMYVQEGGWETDPVFYTNRVSELIDESLARGMYALVDFHQLSPGDPNYNTNNAITFFTEIANRHKDYNNVIYDICNEPNGVPWSSIKNYANQVIPVIRGIDPDAVILVGTHGWGSLGISDGASAQDIVNNPLTFDNIMYTFHFYAASHGMNYYNELDWASDRLPIFVTEFGSQDASGDNANNFTMANAYLDLLAEKKISWCNWNYSDDFRSGAVWQTGTCSSGNYTTSNLKEAGLWVRERMLVPEDDWGGTPVVQSPYLGYPAAIPGVIEAENFDVGGEGIAYHDLSSSNEGGAYRLDEAVDVEIRTAGGYSVGWIASGEWLEYTVNVAIAGSYSLSFSSSATTATGSIRVRMDDIDLTGIVALPPTGDWGTWQTTTVNNISLSAGNQILKIEIIDGDFNLNNLSITQEMNPTIPNAPNNLTATAISGSQINLSWNDLSDNEDEFNIARSIDGAIWTIIATVPANTTTYSNTGLTEATTYQYKVRASNAAGNSGYSNVDQATTSGGDPLNIALNKSATASSLESADYQASNANDGNESTRWASAESDPQWLMIDLDAVATINKVELLWETAYASNYQIQLSNDAINWNTIYTETNGNGGLDILNVNGSGRYIRMLGTSRGTAWGYSIYEFRVYSGDVVPMAPIANINGPYSQTLGQACAFSSAGSYDPDGSIVSYLWNFGDGNTSTQANPFYTYNAAGNYNVSLIVTDNDGMEGSENTTAFISDGGGCSAPAWDLGTVYTGGMEVSHAGEEWRAKWWTLGEEPGTTGQWGVWEDLGPCGTKAAETLASEALNSSVYPSPFSDELYFSFELVKGAKVHLKIYSSQGAEVSIEQNKFLPTGKHTLKIDTSELTSGIYVYRLEIGDDTVYTNRVIKQ